MRIAIEGEGRAAALVQLEEELERAAPDRLHRRVVRADHEALVAARRGLGEAARLAQRDAQPAAGARGRDGDADDAAADHDDIGRAAHSRPASAA